MIWDGAKLQILTLEEINPRMFDRSALTMTSSAHEVIDAWSIDWSYNWSTDRIAQDVREEEQQGWMCRIVLLYATVALPLSVLGENREVNSSFLDAISGSRGGSSG